MRTVYGLVFLLTFGALVSCQEEAEVANDFQPMDIPSAPEMNSEIYDDPEMHCEVIDFDTQDPMVPIGFITEVYTADGVGPIGITGEGNSYTTGNAAMIFDSANPTGGDLDLGTPNETFSGPGIGSGGEAGMPFENDVELGKVLIISEDGDDTDPDDDKNGGKLTLDFTSLYSTYDEVRIKYVDILDVETIEQGQDAFAEILDESDNVLQIIALPAVEDNGYNRIYFEDHPSVYKMVVNFLGSGAIDNIAFCVVEKDPGCTYTQGYYRNHEDDWCGVAPEDDFFLSGHDYMTAITTPTRGNAYYILSQQYVAAVNNVCRASYPEEVGDAIEDAEGWFNEYTPDEIGDLRGNNPLRSDMIDAAGILDDYNNGRIGPGHCDD